MPPLAPALPPGCPWSGFTPPNLDWCEEELCSWIVNPADTWSNLLYVVLGALMWREARRRRSRSLAPFGPASIAVGVFSFAYHASYTWMLQFFDFVGMFLFCGCVLALNARRLGWITPRHQAAATLGGVVALSAALPLLFARGFPIQALVLGLVIAIVAQEAWLLRRDGPLPAHRFWWGALALLAAAAVASGLDLARLWCDPRNHWLQGHALWHVLSASSLYALFRFGAALDLDSGLPEGA